MFSFWGEELGFSGGDVHAQRAYRIYLDYGPEKVIDSVQVVVEGELISRAAAISRRGWISLIIRPY